MDFKNILIIGAGQVGTSLYEIVSKKFTAYLRDVDELHLNDVTVLHITYPYYPYGGNFFEVTKNYIEQYKPLVAIIESTIPPGTTRKLQSQVDIPIVYSPVRGKHVRLKDDMLKYTKFVSGVFEEAVKKVMDYYKALGLKVEKFSSPEALELAKLVETTYLGVLIAYAQEVERIAKMLNVDYYEVMSFTREIDYLPFKIFVPGYIGGHCIIPNLKLLKEIRNSQLFEAILTSNEEKKEELLKQGKSLEERVEPIDLR